ncbi:hypothetical protein N6L26_03340 [Qipengyuania sp. SS22]|uniref:hypothetical protein n=1 Tax=Qipengyuania sp. SS22 TaxID=2979461 RepID=UPI0021E538DD|nr:hypothetical protein [Qipengyuania sp. SS22]UYH55611.1 hypothetical protein N6L26_03340 [Qipengyuania sp. SS22]
MLKRLLACLALLTGLAAAGAPAHAVAYDAASGVERAVDTENPCQGEASIGLSTARQSLVAPRATGPGKPAAAFSVVIPTVQMGVDRAYE